MKFTEGKIIEKFVVEKDGEEVEVIFRYPKRTDLKTVWKFYNKVIKETEFLARYRPVSRKEEQKWLSEMLEGMKKTNKIYVVAEHDGKIIGSATIERQDKDAQRHVGVYGISILQAYTGLGLGKRLTKLILDIAKQEMKLEIVRLSVYGKNKIAQNLYKKFSFKYIGKIPKGRKRNGKYDDEILMYKVIK